MKWKKLERDDQLKYFGMINLKYFFLVKKKEFWKKKYYLKSREKHI